MSLPGGFSVFKNQMGDQVRVSIFQYTEVAKGGAPEDAVTLSMGRMFPSTATNEEILCWCEDALRGERDYQLALMEQADERAVQALEAISALEHR